MWGLRVCIRVGGNPACSERRHDQHDIVVEVGQRSPDTSGSPGNGWLGRYRSWRPRPSYPRTTTPTPSPTSTTPRSESQESMAGNNYLRLPGFRVGVPSEETDDIQSPDAASRRAGPPLQCDP